MIHSPLYRSAIAALSEVNSSSGYLAVDRGKHQTNKLACQSRESTGTAATTTTVATSVRIPFPLIFLRGGPHARPRLARCPVGRVTRIAPLVRVHALTTTSSERAHKKAGAAQTTSQSDTRTHARHRVSFIPFTHSTRPRASDDVRRLRQRAPTRGGVLGSLLSDEDTSRRHILREM